MSLRENRRAAALDRIADHMLAHGLAPSSLRALAKTAGTSDRMLLYYFADKDEIVAAALQTITARLAALLGVTTLAGRRHAPGVVLAEVASIIRGPAVQPYMRLGLELAALAAHGEQPYRRVAGQIADGFAAMLAGLLDIDDDAKRQAAAASLLATIDGIVLLDAVGRAALATQALDSKISSTDYTD
jgi:AcrR family transcriptional regulator